VRGYIVMGLKYLIEAKLNSDKSKSLWKALVRATEACKHHLNQITSQLRNYDIHDEKHSVKVLENIEAILGEKANELSCYELILIYSSCFFHDAAMALPTWEYDLLKAAEGCDECYDNTVEYPIRNDFKPSQTLSDLNSFINNNKNKIYGDFRTVTEFIFSPTDENSFQIDLATRVRDYEMFRNEFADNLDVYKADLHLYLNYSSLLRSEYIRNTHHKRVVDYISNLRFMLSNEVGDATAYRVIDDLSIVCRAHGEAFKFVNDLELASIVDQVGCANLRFVAIILRLGDIVHFSSDRAPLSLFSEKLITNNESIIHWKAKFAETRYDFSANNGKKVINFHAYCKEPSEYYFLQDYLDQVDDEISNYFSFLHDLDFLKIDIRDNYNLQLNNRVNRNAVIADGTKFIPDHTAKFSMDQSKILTLLMGTQLYKDKFLCFRELYQNSLDACKCMNAHDEKLGRSKTYDVVFGIKTDNSNRKHIYCFDNGTGMTKEIVKNYFLRIGNSYYKSREFVGKNINWMNKVNPTSQFGIGVLSCFMIGETIEVTTKYFDDNSEPFAFCLNGHSERFYYLPVDPLDRELIGEHGTLIKIILSEKIGAIINNSIPEDYIYQIYSPPRERGQHIVEQTDQDTGNGFMNSLFYKINNQIARLHPNVNVSVCDSNGKRNPIIQWNVIFDYRKPWIDTGRVASIWSEYHFFRLPENPYKETIEHKDYIKNIPIHVVESGVELDTFISLPMRGIPILNKHIFYFERYIWSHPNLAILIDGVFVPTSTHGGNYENIFGYSLYQSNNFLLNFTGKIRPILSLDRSSIVQSPDEVTEICKTLAKKLIQSICEALISHLEAEKIDGRAEEARLAISMVLEQYSIFSGEILEIICQSKYGSLHLNDLEKSLSNKPEANIIIASPELSLDKVDFRQLDYIAKELLFGKSIAAEAIEVSDLNVKIQSNKFLAPSSLFDARRTESSHCSLIMCVDKWAGEYSQYDLVTDLWPLVPSRVFDKVKASYKQNNHPLDEKRAKILESTSNGLMGIATIEPALVNPKFGISSYTKDAFERTKCLIGHCERIENNYWLFDLNDHGNLRRSQKKDYALFVYVAPQLLSTEDKVKLDDFVGKDDVYVQGVQEGWSILFLGYDQKYFILPGVCEKSRLIELIPQSIRDNQGSVTYYNLDETMLF